jgi:hypothetical protein
MKPPLAVARLPPVPPPHAAFAAAAGYAPLPLFSVGGHTVTKVIATSLPRRFPDLGQWHINTITTVARKTARHSGKWWL